MAAKTSCSYPPSFGSSGALSHVYIQYPPLRCKVPGSRELFYDDGTKNLIAPTSGRVIFLHNDDGISIAYTCKFIGI